MKHSPFKPRTGPQQAELNDALAAIIASTKRIGRRLNLLEIADKVAIARKHLGSLQAVAKAVDLSPEMLRQFSRVAALTPSVKALVAQGKLRSVDIADRISRLPLEDQLHVAESAVCGKVRTEDVRAVLAYRKSHPSLPIESVVNRVLASKNVREYVLEFRVPRSANLATLRSRLMSFFGRKSMSDVKIAPGMGRVIITEEGRRKFEEAARIRGTTRRGLLNMILSGEGRI